MPSLIEQIGSADSDKFLEIIEKEAPKVASASKETQEEAAPAGHTYLTKYQISDAMWTNWATAAGYPGADPDDPVVARKVAAYAANNMFQQFGNWGLVAIGWMYGPSAALAIQEYYGSTPAGSVIESLLGSAGAKMMDTILTTMYEAQPDLLDAGPAYYPGTPPQVTGEVEVNFNPEEAAPGEFEQRRPSGANPAHTALQGVLRAMKNAQRDLRERTAAEVETQQVDDIDTNVKNSTEEDKFNA